MAHYASLPEDRQPVIIGIGEATNRSRDAVNAREPIALMELALLAAQKDAGAHMLADIDALDVVCEYSWPYTAAPDLLCARMGIAPAARRYGEMGGESPLRLIHQMALRIADGTCQSGAVVGAEAQYSVERARKTGGPLNWTPRDDRIRLVRGPDFLNPVAVAHRAATPTNVYPFYENATQVAWGQSPREAAEESALIWSRMSTIAADNPHAWSRKAVNASEIINAGPDNRWIAWPYTKYLVANPNVDMGAAVLLASRGFARRLGIPEHRLVYVWGGAAANEPRDYLLRDGFIRSVAQEAVLHAAMGLAGEPPSELVAMELYSCFPVVPKMARRVLGVGPQTDLSTIGGLNFFGAPLHNYMSHATCGAVRKLREAGSGAKALLYGQGEYVTKHHALVLGRCAPPSDVLVRSYSVQAAADAARGPVPEFTAMYEGRAHLETWTVLFDRQGVRKGVLICRTPDGRRLMAGMSDSDLQGMAQLVSMDTNPIGRSGITSICEDVTLQWRFER
jgi:acetyl-CoA C-acetyltransferase